MLELRMTSLSQHDGRLRVYIYTFNWKRGWRVFQVHLPPSPASRWVGKLVSHQIFLQLTGGYLVPKFHPLLILPRSMIHWAITGSDSGSAHMELGLGLSRKEA